VILFALKPKLKVKRRVEFPACTVCCIAGPSCADAGGRTPPPPRGKTVPGGKQTVDRGVGPTPAPSPRDHHQLPLYLGAAVPPYLRDPRHQSFIDASLGELTTAAVASFHSSRGRSTMLEIVIVIEIGMLFDCAWALPIFFSVVDQGTLKQLRSFYN